MRLKTLSSLAALALAVCQSSAVASPLAQTGAATTAAPIGIQLVQEDRDDRVRRRGGRGSRDGGGDGASRRGGRSGGGDGVYTGGRSGRGDGVYTGGRGGDGVYTGGRSGRGDGGFRNDGRVFCNSSGVCVRDLKDPRRRPW